MTPQDLFEEFRRLAIEIHAASKLEETAHSVVWSSPSSVKKHSKRVNARIAKCRAMMIKLQSALLTGDRARTLSLLHDADDRVAFYSAEHFMRDFPTEAEATFQRLAAHTKDGVIEVASQSWVRRFQEGYALQ